MATTYQLYAGDGTNRNFAVPFPYLDKSHVRVLIDAVETGALVWLSASTVQLTTAPALGAVVRVARMTPTGIMPVDFTDGSILSETELDLISRYSAYVAEESRDEVVNALRTDASGSLDARGLKIVNVAPGVNPEDAVNKAQNDATVVLTGQLKDTAEGAAATATTKAGEAAASALAAQTSGSAQALTEILNGPFGANQIGHDSETVAQSFEALQLSDYAALRAYPGPRKSVYVTGFLVTAAPSGVSGMFVRDDFDTTSADNGGTILVRADGKRYKRAFTRTLNAQWFGAVGMGSTDDLEAIQRAGAAMTSNMEILFPPGVYKIKWEGVKAMPFCTVALDLSHLDKIKVTGDAATILIENHDVGIYGGLLFARIRACRGVEVAGFTSNMSFIGANTSASYYPESGFLYGHNATEGGLHVLADRLRDINVHDCNFNITSQYGSVIQSANPYLGDLNNGGKFYSVFIRGDDAQTVYSDQNTGCKIHDLTFAMGHNAYGIWVWAFSNTRIADNTFEGFASATYNADLTIAGAGVPAIRCHKFYTRNWTITGNILHGRPAPLRVGNLDGYCAMIGFQKENCITSVTENSVTISNNTISVGSHATNSNFADLGVELLCGGVFNIEGNTFNAINGCGFATGVSIGNYVTYNSGIAQYVTVKGNTFLATFGTSGVNGGARPIIYTSANNVTANRTLKNLVVQDNVFNGYNQYCLDQNTGANYPWYGTFAATTYYGPVNQTIKGNTTVGAFNVVGAGEVTNLPFKVWVQETTDSASVTDNTITECYSGLFFEGAGRDGAHVANNTISKNVGVAMQGYGTYAAQITGATTAPESTFRFSRSGNLVNITLGDDVVLTSNSTSKTFVNTNFPPSLFPPVAVRGVTRVVDNGGSYVSGTFVLDTSGILTVYPTLAPGSLWTASGVLVIGQFSLSYTI